MKLRVLALFTALLAPFSAGDAGNDSLNYDIYVYDYKMGGLRMEVAPTENIFAAG